MNAEKYIIPEVSNDSDWFILTGQNRTGFEPNKANGRANATTALKPVRSNQLLVVDVYTEWSGPCLAVESHLRRLRHSFVEAPDTLALARACCDKIEDLQPFKHDIRPTFLFWARGRPVALLRGANRPLLTRLISEEVRMEVSKREREYIEIDFESDKVIQCSGELADLASDEVVRSIGQGSTERLSSIFQELHEKSGKKSPFVQDDDSRNDDNSSHETSDEEKEEKESNGGDAEGHEDQDHLNEQGEDVAENSGENCEDSLNGDDCSSEDEDNLEVKPSTERSTIEATDVSNPFGKKKKKKKRKKLETGLLREILKFK